MAEPWLHVVGIGEDGIAGLAPPARAVLEAAEVIVGAERHHRLTAAITAERVAWPSPFDTMTETLLGLRGRRAVVLVTGDPLWYSAGALLLRALPASEIAFHPALSAFQLAACRMGWPLAQTETLTVHGRPAAQVIPFIRPFARLLILANGPQTPAEVAAILRERGYGPARLTVLSALGGPHEARTAGTAAGWKDSTPGFSTLAVECLPGADALILPTGPGLPDDLFAGDGTMTKAEVRAVTLSRLMPMPGALLWDIGAGCGSVGIEWMRMASDARAIAVEPRADRRAFAAANAAALGTPGLQIIAGEAPAALAGLPAPDAVFLGGGLDEPTAELCLAALKPFGRLVANAVTLDSEMLLARLQAHHGGDLTRIDIARAAALGKRRGWRPSMPVVQWSLVRR